MGQGCNRVEVSRLVITGRVRPLARSRVSLGQQISNNWKEALVACPGGTLVDNLQGYVNKCVFVIKSVFLNLEL